MCIWTITCTIYVVYLAVAFGNLANHVNIAILNVCHLSCKHGFLFIENSKPPINNLANCIFRANRQILDSLIIPRIVDTRYHIIYRVIFAQLYFHELLENFAFAFTNSCTFYLLQPAATIVVHE